MLNPAVMLPSNLTKVLLYLFIVRQPSLDKIEMWFSDWIRNIRAGKKTSYVKSDRGKEREDDEDDEETEELVALGII
jgi:hypothetical protein